MTQERLLLSHVDCEVLSQAQAELAKSCTPTLSQLNERLTKRSLLRRAAYNRVQESLPKHKVNRQPWLLQKMCPA
jgi:hypothetical protein